MLKQIDGTWKTMSDLYKQLEKMQADVAVTRSARSVLLDYMYVCCLETLGRPELTKQILTACASCTRADVALNNLVIRARTLNFMSL